MESQPSISSPALKSVLGSLGEAGPSFQESAPLDAPIPAPALSAWPVLLDAACVQPTLYINRGPETWESAAFQELKRHIQSTGGNVQPIKVRPVSPTCQDQWEVVFGHRRHRACLELGLPVAAFIEAMDDKKLLVEMVHENLARKDGSPLERGLHFQRALDFKVFGSAEELAKAINADKSGVYRLLKLARLPREIVAAFRSPSHLQATWGTRLEAELERDRERVMERALEIAATGTPSDPKQVMHELAPESLPNHMPPPGRIDIERDGRVVATIVVPTPASGEKVTVEFEPGTVQIDVLRKSLQKLLYAFAWRTSRPSITSI